MTLVDTYILVLCGLAAIGVLRVVAFLRGAYKEKGEILDYIIRQLGQGE